MYHGLTSKQAREKLLLSKDIKIRRQTTRSYRDILRANVLTFFNFVNAGLFLLVIATGHIENALFMNTVLFNAFIGIVQEVRAKTILDRMSIIAEGKTEVMRDGEWVLLGDDEIVEGDLIALRMGSQPRMDCELLSGYVETDESILTGESEYCEKVRGDRIYAGTSIASGDGLAKVIRISDETVAARIMEEAARFKVAKSHLKDDLDKLLRIVSVMIIPVGMALYYVQRHFVGLDWINADLKVVAALVGMIPEGLVVLTSLALTAARIRLSRKDVLVQDMYSIEALARIDTVCIDKTGTLTKGEMEVAEVYPLNGASLAEIENLMKTYVSLSKRGNATYDAFKKRFGGATQDEVIGYYPFSSARKYAAFSVRGKGSIYIGAVSVLFPHGCEEASEYIESCVKKGLRVMVLARTQDDSIHQAVLPEKMESCALFVLRDVLRDNAKEMVSYFLQENICVKVISGDDAATVSALALQAGIPGAADYIDVSKKEMPLRDMAQRFTVFGRVMPMEKKELVRSLQEEGHVVAMTGDGVNDVPALKEAAVSVSLEAATPAAKNSANIVLMGNDFAVVPMIVNEGRRVINNILRAASMYLVKTLFSILLSVYVCVTLREYPFLPIHLTILSVFCVGIPTFILQVEPTFEKPSGNFIRAVLEKSAPSGFMIAFLAHVAILARVKYHLDEDVYSGVFQGLAAIVYLYTLCRVYRPLTWLRLGVIVLMALGIFAVYVAFPDFAMVGFDHHSVFALVPGIVVVPVGVEVLAMVARVIEMMVERRKEHGDE